MSSRTGAVFLAMLSTLVGCRTLLAGDKIEQQQHLRQFLGTVGLAVKDEGRKGNPIPIPPDALKERWTPPRTKNGDDPNLPVGWKEYFNGPFDLNPLAPTRSAPLREHFAKFHQKSQRDFVDRACIAEAKVILDRARFLRDQRVVGAPKEEIATKLADNYQIEDLITKFSVQPVTRWELERYVEANKVIWPADRAKNFHAWEWALQRSRSPEDVTEFLDIYGKYGLHRDAGKVAFAPGAIGGSDMDTIVFHWFQIRNCSYLAYCGDGLSPSMACQDACMLLEKAIYLRGAGALNRESFIELLAGYQDEKDPYSSDDYYWGAIAAFEAIEEPFTEYMAPILTEGETFPDDQMILDNLKVPPILKVFFEEFLTKGGADSPR